MNIFFLVMSMSFAFASSFEKEASQLATDLKLSLMKNLSEKISKDGPVEAVSFCHANVKSIAKGAAQERTDKFIFGRTSHKIRNPQNAPEAWVKPYLEKFQGKKKDDVSGAGFVHSLSDGKRVYLEPLFVEARCLLCHGENISSGVKEKLSTLYPDDKATNFKLGEFRGFIWVKEK